MAEARNVNKIFERSVNVSKLIQQAYREIAVDAAATKEAAIVVLVVAVANAVGGAGSGLGGIFLGLIGAFISWILFSVVAWFFGTQLFGTPTTHGTQESLLRTLGYAQAPGILAIFGFIPLLGGIVALIGTVWVFVASVYAIRQVLGLSTGRAIITGVVASIAAGIIFGIIAVITGVGYGIASVF